MNQALKKSTDLDMSDFQRSGLSRLTANNRLDVSQWGSRSVADATANINGRMPSFRSGPGEIELSFWRDGWRGDCGAGG